MVSRNLRFRFTLISYNILSQTLLNNHGYLYTACNVRDLEWPRRGHRIVSELLHNQADIICLQEVESEHLQSLYRPRLANCGYECLYKKKTGYKLDGCAIFYKSKLFHLMNYKGVEFNRTDVTDLLDRDNVGIIAVLKPKLKTRSKSSHLVIANTHLIYNPNRNDIRLAQLKFFLSELEELSLESFGSVRNGRRHHPTILCGDLNSTPDSDVSKFILRTLNHSCQPRHHQQAPDSARETNTDSLKTIADDDGSDESEAVILETKTGMKRQENMYKICDIDNQASNNCIAANENDNVIDDEIVSNCRKHINNHESLNDFNLSMEFKSVYPIQNQLDQRYVSTFSSSIVDYIFYTPRRLLLETYRELLTEDQLDQVGPLPNSQYPSDHISLEAKFTLK